MRGNVQRGQAPIDGATLSARNEMLRNEQLVRFVRPRSGKSASKKPAGKFDDVEDDIPFLGHGL